MYKRSSSKIVGKKLSDFKKGKNDIQIIAESAANHAGNFETLLQLAEISKNAGSDFFTFQIFDINSFCDQSYKSRNITESVCFSFKEWEKFFIFAKKRKIALLPCPCDIKSLKFVVKNRFKLIKVHGTDLTNIPFLKYIARKKVDLILETQLATERDIDLALTILDRDRVKCLMHGYSNYPTEGKELNLNSLDFMLKNWKLPIGFADHSVDTETIPAMALAKGISWIEKHITVSRNDRNYDWQPSLDPEDFTIFVQNLNKYSKTLGLKFKHPTREEYLMRQNMYKKYKLKGNKLHVIRSNTGLDYYDYKYSKFNKDNIITAVIGRLKSTRLKKKILRDFYEDKMVFDLINNLNKSSISQKNILASSYLESDLELIEEAKKRNIDFFCGHPENVIDRMISLAEKEEAKGIFRITADMPLADTKLMDRMGNMFKKYNLDYVRAMNCPVGLSAELFSINYLQKLYQKIDNPNETEYLGWFVNNDKDAKKGCLKLDYQGRDLSCYSLTVDYEEDLESCLKLMRHINKKIVDINLIDVLKNLKFLKKINKNKLFKMPYGTVMKYGDYLEMQWSQGFDVIEKFKIK